MTGFSSPFQIPESLQDLEREPYNLLPYPYDFNDGDEIARAESFASLLDTLEEGNQDLLSADMDFFQQQDAEHEWMNDDRLQYLYTLVR
jgi:hypothetical protein